jgi:hypothetical protein
MKYLKFIYFITIYLAVYSFTTFSAFAENSLGNINNHIEATCKLESTSRGELNVRMYNYCVEHQKNGLGQLKILRNKYGKFDWYDSTEKHCINKWTKRGAIDIFMVYFTMNQQIDGYLDVGYYKKQGMDALVNKCLSKYSNNGYIDWNMTSYCIKQDTNKR